MLVVGLVISALTLRVREEADAAQEREAETAELYEFTRDLAAASGIEEVMQAIITHIGQTLSREVVIFLSEGEAHKPRAASPGFSITESERAVATWAFQHDTPAGRGTDTLPESPIRCHPLKTSRGVVGILGVKPTDPTAHLTRRQRRLIESFASQAALAIERAQLAEQARHTHLLQATEELQTALLNSISHDLRTPLVSITGALSSLREDSIALDEATRRSLVDTASGEAARLNHLVGNLLDMTRVEAGAMRVAQEPCDVQDVIGSALERLEGLLKDRPVKVDLANLPLVSMDFVLMVQVLVNLLDNAIKYSAPGTPIDVCARVTNSHYEITVADRGVGIPPEDLARVFDKFYRVQRPDGVIGTGLGLAICKGIVEAHSGNIRAENRQGGGSIFTLTLPLEKGQTG